MKKSEKRRILTYALRHWRIWRSKCFSLCSNVFWLFFSLPMVWTVLLPVDAWGVRFWFPPCLFPIVSLIKIFENLKICYRLNLNGFLMKIWNCAANEWSLLSLSLSLSQGYFFFSLDSLRIHWDLSLYTIFGFCGYL